MGLFLLGMSSAIAWQSTQARLQSPHPQAILTLGGDFERETFTAQFARQHPNLDIWISSGMPHERSRTLFQTAGIEDDRLHLDNRAVDTVTNFTTLIADLKQREIQHIYLLTSDFHLARARAIATIVLGSQGITFTAVSIPSHTPHESWLRVLRDSGRATLWVLTGRTGASLNPRLSQISS